MKSFNTIKNTSALSLTAAILAAGAAVHAAESDAGSESMRDETAVAEAEPAMTESEKSFVSGTMNLSVNSHFISYGADVWGTGGNWNDWLFQPSLELGLDFGKGITGIVGIWSDINNNASATANSIGSNVHVQEVDVWAGVNYAYEKWSFTVLYQDWMYGGGDELIVDGIIGYDHWLSPSLTIHGRVDNDLGLNNGVVGVVGVAPGKEFGIVSVSLPVNLALNTDDFHGGDAGLTFINAGVGASVPLEFMPGDWSFGVGLTFWYTPSATVPGNPTETFVTGSTSLTLTF